MESNTTRETDRPLLALAWMAGSALAFSLMSVFAKFLSPRIPPFELVFFRAAINFALVLVIMLFRGENLLPPGKPLLVLRGIFGFCGVSCLFYSLAHLPLAIASLLSWSSPLFVIPFSAWFLHERMRRSNLLWVLLAFIGLVLVLNPDLSTTSTQLPLFASLIGLLGAAFSGLAYIAVRAATARVGVNGIVLYFMGISVLLSAPMAWLDFHMPDLGQSALLLGLGVTAAIAQFMMTQAYRFSQAGKVSMMNLLTPAFSVALGCTLFQEKLDWRQSVGIAILFLGIILLTRTPRMRARTRFDSRQKDPRATGGT